MRNSQKRKLNCEKSTKDMKDIGEPLRVTHSESVSLNNLSRHKVSFAQ